MGFILKHDAIVVTSCMDEWIDRAAAMARELGLQVLGPSGPLINGYRTFLVCPDGSKEGWVDSDTGDAKREAFLRYLDSVRLADGSSHLEWVSVAYGRDLVDSVITEDPARRSR